MLQISTRTIADAVVVDCVGEIIYREEAASLRQQVKELLSGSRCVVLNLAGIQRVDSNGIGTLVALLSSAQAGGAELMLAALGKRMKDVLQVTKLTDLFDIHETVEAALESHRLASTPLAVNELVS